MKILITIYPLNYHLINVEHFLELTRSEENITVHSECQGHSGAQVHGDLQGRYQ